MQRKAIRSIVRYSVSTATAAVIVAVYFRWLHVNDTTVAMTFMVGILLVAANWGLRHSIYLSILSATAFNFFFLPPVLTFTVGDPRNWVALLAFLVTGIVASRACGRCTWRSAPQCEPCRMNDPRSVRRRRVSPMRGIGVVENTSNAAVAIHENQRR